MSTRREATHKKLLDAAQDLLYEKGISVRLEDIGRAAGVSRQTVYLHFGSRAGLLTELIEYLDREAESAMASNWIQEAPDGKAALRAMVNQRARYLPIIFPVVGAIIAARQSDPDADAAYERHQKARGQEYETLVNRLKDEGLLAEGWSVPAAVETMRTILSIPAWEQLVIERSWSNQQYADAMHRVLSRTFVGEG